MESLAYLVVAYCIQQKALLVEIAQLRWIVVAWVGEALADFLAECTDTFLDVVRHNESTPLDQFVVDGILV